MNPYDKTVTWLGGKIKSPPMSTEARQKAGFLVRMIQAGEILSMPESRPMPSIGPRCHELRIPDGNLTWRVIYRIDPGAVILVEMFAKKDRKTPKKVIDTCKARLKAFDDE